MNLGKRTLSKLEYMSNVIFRVSLLYFVVSAILKMAYMNVWNLFSK